MKYGSVERRSYKRSGVVRGQVPLSWEDAGAFPLARSIDSEIQDLSQTGVRVLYDSREGGMRSGTVVNGTVRLETPLPYSFKFTGRIAWERRDRGAGKVLSGIYFDSIDFSPSARRKG